MAASSAHVCLQYRDCTGGTISEIRTLRNISYDQMKLQFGKHFADAIDELPNNEESIIETTANKVYIVRRFIAIDIHIDTASADRVLDRQQQAVQNVDDMDAELQSLNATIFEVLHEICCRY